MSLMDKEYSELKLLDKYLSDRVVLAQAWKKTQQYIRSTNWYADTFELDQSTLSLSDNLDVWSEELIKKEYRLNELRLVPAPKLTNWEFVNVPLFPPIEQGQLTWKYLPESLDRVNQSWQPVVSDSKLDPPVRLVPPLRPLAHVPIKEQTYFTALMMCLANEVETKQGDTSIDFKNVHKEGVVSYGNRLFCRYENGEALFPWGNSTVYSKYFTDYQRFLERPSHFGFKALQEKVGSETVYEIHLDLSRFFDKVDREKLTTKIVELASNYDEKRNPVINYLLDKFDDWEWESGSDEIYRLVCQKDTESLPKGIPQGLVAGGFFANVYMLEFDAFMSSVIGTEIAENLKLIDYCRYVDDMRLVVISNEKANKVKKAIESFFNDKLIDLQLELNDKKTKIEIFRTKSSGISTKLKAIQGKVSGPISNREIDEQLGHLEGLINLSDYLRSNSEHSEGNNPLYLVEAPNHDVREDTLVRFAANKIHRLLRQKRSFYAPDLDNDGEIKPGSWDFLQERMARKFIACWTKDPSLTLLLKKGLELFPNVKILESIISQLGYVKKRNDDKQKYLAEYFLCEIFRHSATIIQVKEQLAFPAHSDREGYFEYLQCLAVEILEEEKSYSLNVRQQARFFLLVRNDSPLDYESEEDQSFNTITKLIKGYRRIANDIPPEQFAFKAILAYQLAEDPQKVIRAVSSFLEKVNNTKRSTRGVKKRDLKLVAKTLAIESSHLFEQIISYSNKSGLSWQKQTEVTRIVNQSGFYLNAVLGDL